MCSTIFQASGRDWVCQDFHLSSADTSHLLLTIYQLHPICLIYASFLFLFPKIVWGQDLNRSEGQSLFIQNCSRCHGVKGGGGEGPALNRFYLPRAGNDAAFAELITNGIPGTSMPAIWSLSKNQITQVIQFVRELSTTEKEEIRGDPENGFKLIQKSGCLSCHLINGKGISVGPDLGSVGIRRGSAYIRETLRNPGNQKVLDANGFILYLVVDVTESNGQTIRGVRLNEDTYTIQFKDSQNQFYSFRKSELKSIERMKDESLMPAYSTTMSKEDIEDIVAFLMIQK
jgi:cytochrome c oxidase cbb3-type subunit III